MTADPRDIIPCHTCRTPTQIDLLDAKPKSLAGVAVTHEMLAKAANQGKDFDVLECKKCYGPAWAKGQS